MGTGYFDQRNNEINIGSKLLFNNASMYKVIINNNKILLQCLNNVDIPLIKLSKVTYGNILCSATII